MDPNRRPCPICLGTDSKLTKEDMFPSWGRRAFLQAYPAAGQAPARYTAMICKRCNQRLGAAVQQPFSKFGVPLFIGSESTLTVDQQAVVASWAVISACVTKLAHPSRGQTANEDLTRELLEATVDHGMPPTNSIVRIASFLPERTNAPTGLTSYFDYLKSFYRRFGFNRVLSMGRLLFEVTVGLDPDILVDLVDAMQRDFILTRIWPEPTAVLTWPPIVTLRDPDANELRAAWGHPPGIVYRGETYELAGDDEA